MGFLYFFAFEWVGEESGGKKDVLCAHALAGPPGSVFYDLRIQNGLMFFDVSWEGESNDSNL